MSEGLKLGYIISKHDNANTCTAHDSGHIAAKQLVASLRVALTQWPRSFQEVGIADHPIRF